MQSTFVRLAAVAAILLVASACDRLQDTLYTAGPVTPTAVTGEAPPTAPSKAELACDSDDDAASLVPSQYALFRMAYYCAWVKSAKAAKTGDDIDLAAAQPALRSMAREGFGLIRSNCDDFFRRKGNNQQNLALGRDFVGWGAATATAIVGLTGGSALALSIITVSGSALYMGMDAYTKEFLFGADNIEAVRAITMQSLDGNRDQVLQQGASFTFQTVASAIMDNQEMCRPAAIAAAVRHALGTTLTAAPPSDTSGLDAARIAMIASLVGAPGVAITDQQLAALCWAANPVDDSADKTAYLTTRILPASQFPMGPAGGIWDKQRQSVASQCSQLSTTRIAAINTAITQLQAAAKGAAGGGAPLHGMMAQPTTGAIVVPQPGLAPVVQTPILRFAPPKI